MFQTCDPYDHQCGDGLETKSAELYLCLVVCEMFMMTHRMTVQVMVCKQNKQ